MVIVGGDVVNGGGDCGMWLWMVVHSCGNFGRWCGECGWWRIVVVIVWGDDCGECGWWCMDVVIVGGGWGWWVVVFVLDNFRQHIAPSISLCSWFTVPRKLLQCTPEADSLCPYVGTQWITFILNHSHPKRVQAGKVILPHLINNTPSCMCSRKSVIPLQRDERKFKKTFFLWFTVPRFPLQGWSHVHICIYMKHETRRI